MCTLYRNCLTNKCTHICGDIDTYTYECLTTLITIYIYIHIRIYRCTHMRGRACIRNTCEHMFDEMHLYQWFGVDLLQVINIPPAIQLTTNWILEIYYVLGLPKRNPKHRVD